MPTRKQLHSIWESQLEYFGGSGQPKQSYGINQDEHGLYTQQQVDTPLTVRNQFISLEGVKIGKITIDPESKDLKIIVNP